MRARSVEVFLVALPFLFFVSGKATPAETDQPTVVLFYEEECPSCTHMEEVLQEIVTEYPSLSIARYELSQPGSLDLLEKLSKAYAASTTTVPVIFVGDEVIAGAERPQEMQLRSEIERCLILNCPSPLSLIAKSGIAWKDIAGAGIFVALFLFLLWIQER
jgi:glutaredoxin